MVIVLTEKVLVKSLILYCDPKVTCQRTFQNGANVNSKKNFGETALHEAAKQGHLQIVQYLVEKGKNHNKTVFIHYSFESHKQSLKFIKNKGSFLHLSAVVFTSYT